MAYYHYQGVAQKRNDGEMHRPLKTFEILLFSNIHVIGSTFIFNPLNVMINILSLHNMNNVHYYFKYGMGCIF